MAARRWLATMGLLLGALLLIAAGPRPDLLRALAEHPQATVDAQGADSAAVAVVGCCGWLLVGWLALGTALMLATRLPGTVGVIADQTATRLLPRTLRQALVLAVGLSLVSGTAAAAGNPIEPVHRATRPPAASLDLDWPTGTVHRPAPQHPAAHAVIVHRGDTLWAIAGRALGPDADDAAIAAEWPRWYAANRTVIGADPDLIKPGQILHAPTARRTP